MIRYLLLIIGIFLLPGISESAPWSVEAALKTYIKDHYPWAEVDISGLQLGAEMPAEEPSSITVEKTPPGNAVFRLHFPGKKSIRATAFIKAFERVIMSRGAYRKGYVLRQQDMYSTLMESVRMPKSAVREEDRIIGKSLARSIVSNVPITEDMVLETPLVKRGHKVVLFVEASGFSIKTMGETRQDASVGDYVKAVNLNSKRVVTGLLVDENTVRVEF
jgi:flagella basal body P-ring formation protein FlgA